MSKIEQHRGPWTFGEIQCAPNREEFLKYINGCLDLTEKGGLPYAMPYGVLNRDGSVVAFTGPTKNAEVNAAYLSFAANAIPYIQETLYSLLKEDSLEVVKRDIDALLDAFEGLDTDTVGEMERE